MGTDIHAYIDVAYVAEINKKPHGKGVDSFAAVHIGRDYELFNCLAGVRSDDDDSSLAVVKPRGLPKELGFITEAAFYLYIREDGEEAESGERSCLREQAKRWVKNGSSHWCDSTKNQVSDPDAHSMSWATLEELIEVQENYTNELSHPNCDLAAIIGAMQALKRTEKDVDCYYDKTQNKDIEVERITTYEPRLVYWFDN